MPRQRSPKQRGLANALRQRSPAARGVQLTCCAQRSRGGVQAVHMLEARCERGSKFIYSVLTAIGGIVSVYSWPNCKLSAVPFTYGRSCHWVSAFVYRWDGGSASVYTCPHKMRDEASGCVGRGQGRRKDSFPVPCGPTRRSGDFGECRVPAMSWRARFTNFGRERMICLPYGHSFAWYRCGNVIFHRNRGPPLLGRKNGVF